MNEVSNKKISKQEEARALNVLCKYTTSDPAWPKELVRTKKYDDKRSNDPEVPDEIYFVTTYTSGTNRQNQLNYIIKIRKNDEGKIEFYLVNRGVKPEGESLLHNIKPLYEAFKKHPNPHISKEEEAQALQLLRSNYGADPHFRKTLRKVKHIISDNPYITDKIHYYGEFEGGSKTLLCVGKDFDNKLSYLLLDPRTGEQLQNHWIPLNENIQNPTLLTKEDEWISLKFIKNLLKRTFPKSADKIKFFKRISDRKIESPNARRYTAVSTEPGISQFKFRIVKLNGSINIQDLTNDSNKWYDLTYTGPLMENTSPVNLHINKKEEDYAFSRLKIRKNNQGEPIGKYLKKKNHVISSDPQSSDQITYLNFDDGTSYTIVKDDKGRLGFCAGYIAPISATGRKLGDDYVSHNIDLIKESVPTGDWHGWEDITQPEKDRLKEVLKELQEYYKKYYSLVGGLTYVYLLKKVIDNLDTTDPRYAARPLSHFPMEYRLMMMGFVDQKDTTGSASKVFDFLISLSRQYIEPPTPPKPDIELKGITDIVYPGGRNRGDVFIHGIDDMKPIINFGYGPYNLNKNFIDQFSEPGAFLYLDSGQGVKVINMPEVMRKVQEAMKDYYKKDIDVSESLKTDTKFQLVMKRGKREVFIGNFPTEYRAYVVAIRLEWDPSWKPIITPINKLPVISETKIFDPNWYEKAVSHLIKAHSFTKQEEDFVKRHLSNIVFNGVRLGKTLKKIYQSKPKTADDWERIDFSADSNGIEKIYRVVKWGPHEAIVRDASTDGDFKRFKIPLKENFDGSVKLTKEEEYRGLQFIRSFLLPEAVKRWNDFNREEPIVLESEVRKNLVKKIDNEVNPHTNERYNTYQVILPKYGKFVLFNFFVSKQPKDGKIFISYQDAKGNGTQPYPLKENTSPRKTTISKEDLQKAIQTISNLTDSGERLGKTLKKVSVIQSDNPNVSDWQIYEANPHGNPTRFSICYSWRRGIIIYDLTNNIQLINGKYPQFGRGANILKR